jgi:hypothetical protein
MSAHKANITSIQYVGEQDAENLQKDPNAVVGDFNYNTQAGTVEVLTAQGWKTMITTGVEDFGSWQMTTSLNDITTATLVKAVDNEIIYGPKPTPPLPYIELLLEGYDKSYLTYKASYDSLDETYGEDEVNVVLGWASKIAGWVQRRINARHDPSCWKDLRETLAEALYISAHFTDEDYPLSHPWKKRSEPAKEVYRTRADKLLANPQLLIMKGDPSPQD